MLYDQRVLFSNNGTITDLSVNLNNFRSGAETIDYTTAQDFIYIASFLPFNHKHFDVGTVQDTTAAVTVELWDGSNWQTAVDVIDRTDSGGVSMAQDGIISFSPDIDVNSWQREREAADVTGLTSPPAIYNMYWARFSWSATWGASTTLEFIGDKFSVDTDLYDIYPDLNNSSLQAAFETAKSDWEEQHYLAAQKIVRDLKNNHLILAADQILDASQFKEASIHACAMRIYWGLSRFELHDHAKSKYEEVMKQDFLTIDMNLDGRVNPAEKVTSHRFLSR